LMLASVVLVITCFPALTLWLVGMCERAGYLLPAG